MTDVALDGSVAELLALVAADLSVSRSIVDSLDFVRDHGTHRIAASPDAHLPRLRNPLSGRAAAAEEFIHRVVEDVAELAALGPARGQGHAWLLAWDRLDNQPFAREVLQVAALAAATAPTPDASSMLPQAARTQVIALAASLTAHLEGVSVNRATVLMYVSSIERELLAGCPDAALGFTHAREGLPVGPDVRDATALAGHRFIAGTIADLSDGADSQAAGPGPATTWLHDRWASKPGQVGRVLDAAIVRVANRAVGEASPAPAPARSGQAASARLREASGSSDLTGGRAPARYIRTL